jgi:hypothetical protein
MQKRNRPNRTAYKCVLVHSPLDRLRPLQSKLVALTLWIEYPLSQQMGPPSLVAAAANRRNTRASLTEDNNDPAAAQTAVDEPHFPRRFPRTGNAFQCKIGAFRGDECGSLELLSTYESSRPVPQPMSVDYPHATMDVVAQAALESTSRINAEIIQRERDVDKQGES